MFRVRGTKLSVKLDHLFTIISNCFILTTWKVVELYSVVCSYMYVIQNCPSYWIWTFKKGACIWKILYSKYKVCNKILSICTTLCYVHVVVLIAQGSVTHGLTGSWKNMKCWIFQLTIRCHYTIPDHYAIITVFSIYINVHTTLA